MSFSIHFGPQAAKFIKRLDNTNKLRLKNRFKKLKQDPFPQEVERVEGYKGEKVFRIRIGFYRILYLVRYDDNEILIAKIDKRGRVYK